MGKSSRTRVDADNVSLRTQTRSLLLDRLTAETDSVALSRDANTAKLRQQRLDRAAQERASAPPPAAPKPRKTPA